MDFVSIREILDGKYEEKEVSIRGWIHRKREGKQTVFLVMRDASGVVQCTVKKESQAWPEAERITIESSATLRGTVRKDPASSRRL